MATYGIRVADCDKVAIITLYNCNHINEKLSITQEKICSIVKVVAMVVRYFRINLHNGVVQLLYKFSLRQIERHREELELEN